MKAIIKGWHGTHRLVTVAHLTRGDRGQVDFNSRMSEACLQLVLQKAVELGKAAPQGTVPSTTCGIHSTWNHNRVLVDCALAPWMVAMNPGVNPLVARFSPHVQVPVPRVRDVAVCLL